MMMDGTWELFVAYSLAAFRHSLCRRRGDGSKGGAAQGPSQWNKGTDRRSGPPAARLVQGLHAALHLQLLIDVAHVRTHRVQAHEKLVRYLLHPQPLGKQVQHLLLTHTERYITGDPPILER